MRGSSLLTIVGSAAAFAMGYLLFQGNDHPSQSNAQLLSAAAKIASSEPSEPTPTSIPAEPLLPLELVSEVEFTQFDPDLNLTPEARLLLGISSDEAEAVSKAAHELRDSIEHAQSQTAKARYEDPMSNEEKLFVEVDPLGTLATTLTDTFRSQIQQTLGTARADLIATPVEISPNHTVLYTPTDPLPPPSGLSPEQLARYNNSTSSSANQFRQIKMVQVDGNLFSYQSFTEKRVPTYVTEFFAMQEEAE